MGNLLIAVTANTISIIMYLVVGILLLGNILFLILFIGGTAKCTNFESDLQIRNREKIANTEHDKKSDQPVGARMEDNQLYVIKEAKDNFNVVEKESKKVVAVAKTKDEAREIIKSMVQKN